MFKDIPPGSMIHHRHNNNRVEEATASAKTWRGRCSSGFFCYTCQINYVARGDDFCELEPRYCFTDKQVRHSEVNPETQEVYPFISDPDKTNRIKWIDEYLAWKYIVIDAHMGSGKTEELSNLMVELRNNPSSDRKRVLVITFCVALAFQLASRLKVTCYKVASGKQADQVALDEKIKNDEFDSLVVCVNSLGKLGRKPWDIIIFDKCGLIRLHLVATITAPQLHIIFPNLIRHIIDAKNVILAQEFISEKDVDFYTRYSRIDPYSPKDVKAFRFVKPVKIHDIEWTDNFFVAVNKMLEQYDNAFDKVTGKCIRPFMVFVTKVPVAEFLLHILEKECKVKWKDRPQILKQNLGQLKGLWRVLRYKTKFACNFLINPMGHAMEADVIVATSIIGAGFSIDVRFVSFHAFLSCDVLDHWMQRQLIQRLCAILKHYKGETATPIESYLYMEKGRGKIQEDTRKLMEDLLQGFNSIRAEIIKRAVKHDDILAQTGHYLDALEDTQVTSAARTHVTRQMNDDL